MTTAGRGGSAREVCETHHKSGVRRAVPRLLAILLVLCAASALTARLLAQPEHQPAQPAHADPPAEQDAHASEGGAHGQAGAHGEEAGHDTIWTVVARVTNFAILAGALVYLLRSPLATYLADKSAMVRKELVDAEALRNTAAAQLREIEEQLRSLPAEIESLKARGAQEIAAEEARIAKAAETERERLLEQTRREIDLQLRIARRQLIADAAELAVGVASERIKRNITDQDQERLVKRYLEQVSRRHE